MNFASLLLLLWSLVEVHSQSVPYVSFMSQPPLANHAYVDISQVGNDGSGSDSVQCHTDLESCCTVTAGSHRGDWYFPDGNRLPFQSPDVDIYEFRVAQRVDLRRRNNANSPVGIYRCDIPTVAVHDGDDTSVRDTVYVGLYTASGGDISISGGVAFDPDQLTLTCISTGGPATTVTWTRDSTTVTQGTQTVLNDPETAQYTHTLTIAAAGEYTCTVANNKPSSASATITVTGPEAPTGVTAFQNGPTSITVTWTPPSPLDGITGYRISFTGGNDVDIDGGSTNSYILTGLTNGQTYTISIVATTNNLASDTVTAMAVGLVPGQPTASIDSTTATTISLSWSVPSGSVYLIEWTRDTSVGCSDQDTGSTTITGGSMTNYTITGLEEDSSYTITVTASNGAGTGPVSNAVTAMTEEAAPSAPPSEVEVTDMTSSTITVVWGEVPCADQNGAITGYSVQYGVVGSGSTQTMAVDGATVTQTTIENLMSSTTYSIEVAAVNSAGIGEYSDPRNQLTRVEAPVVTVVESSVTATSVPVSWSSGGSEGVSYVVEWAYGGECPDISGGSQSVGGDRQFTIVDLEEYITYSITVRASNFLGSVGSTAVNGRTSEATPTAPPGSLSSSSVTPNSVTPNSFSIQWGRVPCIHRNGDITGYSVLVQGNGSMRSIDVNDPDVLTTDISGLMSDTMYLVQVAGVNRQGTGVYRDLTVTTPQTVYLNFGGMNLPTNGLVNISQLGNSTGTGLVCSTDQSADGTPAGRWFNPDGTMLSSSSSEGFFVSDGSDGVYLLRGSGIPVEGIYTCSATDSSGNSRTFFVGLYNEQGGEVGIDGEIGFTLVSELTAVEPQFTLSCNSTDGPATSVIWTRNSDPVGEGTTVLNDAVTAHYTHTLTVTGRLGGVYVCTVSNSISTTASSGQNIEVASSPTNVMVTQETATSFRLSWTPPDPLGDTTGYTISYTGGGSSGSVNVAGGSTDSFSLTGLDSGETYTISLIGRSRHIPGTAITAQIVPSPLSPTDVTAIQDGPTSITVTWTPPSPLGGTTGYRISYTGGGSSGSETVSGGDINSYTLTGLTNGQTYTISIVATSEHLFSDATSFEITLIPAPGQVFVSVSSITATSISLSWSVSSGRVASWEVVWRPTDRGTESTSGSLSGTTYTILQLDPSTIYTLTVSATNVAGTTDSTPILVSTVPTVSEILQAENIDTTCSESGATIGGVVGAVLIIAAATIVLHVAIALLLRRRRGNYSTSAKRRGEMVDAPATVLELSKIPDETYASPFQTTSNEAYNVVRGTGRTAEVEYEIPQNLPPPTTSSQPAAGDHFYEPV